VEKVSCKLLFVDDSDNERILFHVAFRRANPRHLRLVTTLANGDEAIMYLAGEGKFCDRVIYPFPDILVLDLKMPFRTGFDVLEWVRNQKLLLPTIVNSDSGERCDMERALDLGARDYHKKAPDLLALIDWVRHLDESWAQWHAGNGWRSWDGGFREARGRLASPPGY
jgi:CheY-like chemotaxis protein